jgi:hypothetical protein
MSSEPLLRRGTFVLVASVASALGCVSVDVYPGPQGHGAADAGASADASGHVSTPDGSSDAACTACAEAQCEAEWRACQGEPDCVACLQDPLGARCQGSAGHHDFRNCACAKDVCQAECPALCPTPASVGKPQPPRVSAACIQCTGAQCGTEVNACVVDSVCLACVSDLNNPKCTGNQPWNDTTACLCNRRGTCFEECCAYQP